MAVPDVIPIEYVPDYYTGHIGMFGGGKQFLAQIVASIAPEETPAQPWQQRKRWYAVLHTFDSQGAHLQTKHWYAGTTADGENEVVERARKKRDEFIREISPVAYFHIGIKPFEVEVDGMVFGLIDQSDEDGERVVLEPADLVFYPPWEGEYDT
jgi:hypothetical protein